VCFLSSLLLENETNELTKSGEVKKPEPDLTPKGQPAALKPFIFLDVSVLREYLAVELSAPVHSFPFSLERAIDDWVFLIFFVGNDFLPHLPSLEIREGAIDTLMTIWKANLDRMGGYLTEHGKVRLERAQIILEQLAMREDEIFRKRREGASLLSSFPPSLADSS
jgi:5'-3' exoribonuclease 2